ncbi:MAG: DUF2231 domain-containing protein [Saprospiraceae bacterium]
MISATHLHAMIVHFPIALLFAGFLSDLLSLITKKPFFKTAALYLLVLGALGAVVAYLTGNAAGEGMDDGTGLGKAMEIHEDAALLTLLLSLIAAAFRVGIEVTGFKPKWGHAVSVALFALAIASVARTGYYGGELVFKHGAGVQLEISLTPDAGQE